jgi:dolichol-phosphate mannosyltransferase
MSLERWVVTPTYNEAQNLERLLRGLREALPDLGVLVVDDGSPDGTGDLAERLGQELGRIEILHREGKQGLASAYLAGFTRLLEMGADQIVQMDADLSHDTADVPRLFEALDQGADLALGSRYVPGGGTRNWPLNRRILSRFGSMYSRFWLGLPYRDLTGGFKAWRRATLEAALARPLESDGYAFQVEMTWRVVGMGGTITEVPIVFTEREDGVSKMSRTIAVEAAWVVPRLRFRK